MNRRLLYSLCISAALLIGDLSAQVSPRILNGQVASRILNGVETDDFESVGIVGSLELGGYCTGTLITPRHVLTAAHCAELVVSDTDGTFIVGGELYTTSRVIIHPDYDPDTLDNDIAIYELSEVVDGVETSAIFRDEPMVGDVLTIVGFGAPGDGPFGTKRFGSIAIDVVSETLVSWEYDSVEESNTTRGDSGGPNFLSIDGELVIASVTSGGSEPDSGLGDIAFNTRVDAFQDWIDVTIDSMFEVPADEEDEPADEEDEPTDEEVEQGGCPGGYGRNPLRFVLGLIFGAINDQFEEDFGVSFFDWLAEQFGDGSDGGSPDVEEEPGDVVEESPEEVVVVGPPDGVGAGPGDGVARRGRGRRARR